MRGQIDTCNLKTKLRDAKNQLTELDRKLRSAKNRKFLADDVAKAIESIDQAIALAEAGDSNVLEVMKNVRHVLDLLIVIQQLFKLFLG